MDGAAVSDRISEVEIYSPNKPDAVNPAMTLLLTFEDQWRRVTDLDRSAN
jgi:hypothetical protein